MKSYQDLNNLRLEFNNPDKQIRTYEVKIIIKLILEFHNPIRAYEVKIIIKLGAN